MTSQATPNFKPRFLRVNPFRGLLVDENTWADAHDYHRNQMRFHLLAMHGVGIVQGLDVVASQPADTKVTVRPGLAIDPEGRMLFLPEQQIISIPSQANLSLLFLVLEYVEKPTQTQNVGDSGTSHNTRVLEECQLRISQDPSFNGIELARINLDTNARQIRNVASTRQASTNEIDLSGRMLVAERGGAGVAGGGKGSRIALTLGVIKYGAPGNMEWKRHSEGLRRLIRDTTSFTNLDGNLLDGVNLMDEAMLRGCRMLYLTGRSAFRFSAEEEQALRRFLDRGGLVWSEPCRNGIPSGAPDDFSRSCIELTQRLNRQPIQPRAGHPLFTAQYLFAAPPPALDTAGVVVESNRMIVTTGDYGCLWEGRGQANEPPPAREILRSAQEFGANALFMAATAVAPTPAGAGAAAQPQSAG